MSTTKFTHKPDVKAQLNWCLERWQNLYDQWNGRENAPQFLIHDGPPYANGDIHMGHAVNKTLKDCINRFMAMRGYRINFVPGWDCHGLPIEAKVEEEFRKKGLKRNQVDVEEFRQACADFAQHWIDAQKESFRKIGVIGDEKYYTTMSQSSELGIIELIHKFATKNLIYQDLKPVMWSFSEATALAEAEVEYMMKESTTIDVAIPISYSLIPELGVKSYIPIWTTTTWTIPANRAVAYHKDFMYVIVSDGERNFVVAKDLLEQFAHRTKLDLSVIKEIQGDELDKTICLHPLYEYGFKMTSPLVESDHVNLEQGTGFVHVAPDYGLDDFNISKREGIPCCNYLNDHGYFDANLPDFLANRFYTDTEPDIVGLLNDKHRLLSLSKIKHSYPHSWRSRKPLIQRATKQWFIKLDDPKNNLRQRAVESVDKVSWLPRTARERFLSMLVSRASWCISRQRAWGTPIALFYHRDTGELLLKPEILQRTMDFLTKHGVGAWWNTDLVQAILPETYSDDYMPITDIVDVWFESGAIQYFVFQKQNLYPADMYIEGSDQHRAWFQASLLTSCIDGPNPPFKCVKTHGYVVDSNKRKMSKSLGNGQDPIEIIEKYGADVLRLWVLRQNTIYDITWSMNQIADVEKIQNKIRNTIKFLVTNASPEESDIRNMPEIEQWILSLVAQIQDAANSIDTGRNVHSEGWEIHNFLHKVYEFCDRDLSRLYFDIRKDALYWDAPDSVVRKQVMYCLHLILEYLLRWIAPIMPFAADEAWSAYKLAHNQQDSTIHSQTFLNMHESWTKKVWELDPFHLRDQIYKEIEVMRNNPDSGIKTSLDADVYLTISNEIVMEHEYQVFLKQICMIADLKVSLQADTPTLINIKPSTKLKCTRCKKRVSQLNEGMCIRCSSVMHQV